MTRSYWISRARDLLRAARFMRHYPAAHAYMLTLAMVCRLRAQTCPPKIIVTGGLPEWVAA